MGYYDRYQRLRSNGVVNIMPNVIIDKASSDLVIIFDKSKMRFDTLSYKYYGDSNYGWLILMANPKYGSLEFNIPNGVPLRIPYPLSNAISRYETAIDSLI